MAAERSKKLHHLMAAVLMLAMGVAQVVFAMGGEATWFPPLYFGISSVAYLVLLIVEIFEENQLLKAFIDALSHICGLLTLTSIVAIVSIGFAVGLLCSIALVFLWYAIKRHHNNPPTDPAANSRSESMHLILLTSLGGAIVFGQIALAMGMKPSTLPLTFFRVCAVSYLFFRCIEVMEDHAGIKLAAGYLSWFAGGLSLLFFVGILSQPFALAALITGATVVLLLACRCCCAAWWNQPTADELADEVQTLLSADELV